jgi:hypothetical protein
MDFLETIITEKLPRKLFETIESELVNHTVESRYTRKYYRMRLSAWQTPKNFQKIASTERLHEIPRVDLLLFQNF